MNLVSKVPSFHHFYFPSDFLFLFLSFFFIFGWKTLAMTLKLTLSLRRCLHLIFEGMGRGK